jgi:hypothetical protein
LTKLLDQSQLFATAPASDIWSLVFWVVTEAVTLGVAAPAFCCASCASGGPRRSAVASSGSVPFLTSWVGAASRLSRRSTSPV